MQRNLDQIAPKKTKKTLNRKKKPWFNNELYEQQKMKNRERVWLKYSNPAQWKAYTRERNKYNTLLKYRNVTPSTV